MKGSLINFKAAVLLIVATCLFILAGCGSGGNGSSEVPQNAITEPTAQYKETAIVAWQGEIKNLILSGTTLFWGDGSSGKGILKYKNGDTSPQLLVPRLSYTSNIVVRGNYAYWINTDSGRVKFSIYRTTLDGSHTTLLTQGDAPFPTAYLSADDKALYFTAKDTSTYNTGTKSVLLQRFPLDGSAPTTLYRATMGAVGLAADDSYIYMLDETGADGFAANLVRISKMDGSSQMLSQNIASVNGTIAIANGAIYVGTYDNKLLKVTAMGGIPTVFASVEAYWLTVIQDTIYWINYNRSDYNNPYTIQSMPVGGGAVNVVATSLNQPSNLLATTDGLYWSELQSNGGGYERVLKMLSWQTGQVTTVANGMYISSFDIAGGNAYMTQSFLLTGFSEISMVSLADGLIHPLVGGVNTTTYIFSATTDNLLIGDGIALKKVPLSGGVTTTLVKDMRFDIKDVKGLNGTVYFTSAGAKIGVFKVSESGGSYVTLAQEPGLYGTIVSVQDDYVYYVLSQSNFSGGTTDDLRRVRIDGTAPSESFFKVPPQYSLVQFDGIGTAYLMQWLYNDQYKYLKYDIATGNVVQILSGAWFWMGFNSSSLYIADGFNNVYQVPNTGGKITPVISVPFPLELKPKWVSSGNGFYFVISYLDPAKGYLSEIEYLEKTK